MSYRQTGFMIAARHYEQEAHDRAEVAVAEASAQTQADMLHELVSIEQVAQCTDSNHQMEILEPINSVAEHAMQGPISMLKSEASAEPQSRCESKSSVETRAQANTPLTEIASQRMKLNDLTVSAADGHPATSRSSHQCANGNG